MAKRTFTSLGLTWGANALGSTITGSQYMAIEPVTASTTIVDIDEVMVSGTAGAGAVGAFVGTQMSTFSTTPTALAAPNSDGPMQQNATPVIQRTYVVAGTNPTPSNSTTAPKLNFTLNFYGGIVRWNASPTQQYTCVGNAAPGGFILMNATAGTGASGTANAHIIYEPY
jgi:hypothetical protein